MDTIISGNLELRLIKVPYYTPVFVDIPKNPFSIILFCYLGEINPELYEKYLKLFREIIVKPDPKPILGFSLEKTSHEKFPLNKDIPENAYIFTLTSGEFQDSFDSNLDLLEEVINMIQDEEPSIFSVYHFLGDFFKLSLKFYTSIDDLLRRDEEMVRFNNINSTKEVYFILENDLYPILEQEVDGTIRLKSINI